MIQPIPEALTMRAAAEMDSAQLAARFADCQKQGDVMMREMAIIVCTMQDRGEPLPVTLPWLPHVRDIVEGQLAPQAVLVLSHLPDHLAAVRNLPLDIQERLAMGQGVDVARRRDGRIMFEVRQVWDLSKGELTRVFHDGRIVDQHAQGTALHLRHNAPDDQDDSPKRPAFSINPRTGKPRVSRGGDFEWEDIIQAAAASGFKLQPIYGKPFRQVAS